MTSVRTTMSRLMRVAAVVFTVAALLATAFGSFAAPKTIVKKSGCQRCACCIEKAPDQPQVPLAPSPSRATTEFSAALAPLLAVAVLFERDASSAPVLTARDSIAISPAPIFLRHCAILI